MGWVGLLVVEERRALPELCPHRCVGPPVCPSFDSEKAGDREVQRTMLELLNQLDGFQPNTQVKVSIVTSQVKNVGLRGQGIFSVI